MADIQWSHFKSGTDIRGVALDGVAGEPVDLTDETVARIAGGFARWLSEASGCAPEELTVAVGRDCRLSGPRVRDAVIRALCTAGVSVADCGMASTPAMFMTTVRPMLDGRPCDGAIQITASHHPYHRNGLKFFFSGGGLTGDNISEILEYAAEGEVEPSFSEGTVTAVNFMREYAALLREKILCGVNDGDHPLDDFHIVVDAGNGVGGFYAEEVLQPLGADISGSRFLEPDGRFPHHIPDPEDPEAMAAACAATVEAGADLGIIFDTDVDRAGLVDAAGQPINRNRLIALAAAIVLDEYPDATIVTDSVTSDGLTHFIEQTLGGTHHRFKRGYKNVIEEAIRLCDMGVNAPLAIETSGHAALRENYFLDDGAYLATKLIIVAAKLKKRGCTLSDLIAVLPEPAEAVELRLGITIPDFQIAGEAVLKNLAALAEERAWRLVPNNCEGVRLSFGEQEGDGWLLLRLSVHDPVMPLNIESQRRGGCRTIARAIAPFLRAQQGIDCENLNRYLEEET